MEVLQKLREPSLLFTVAGSIDVPTYYINFRVPEDKREALAAAIPLPEGFTLAPIRMRKNGPKEYIITNNIYSVEGLTEFGGTLRAEWSVFIQKQGSDQVFFFVIDTATEIASLDPANPEGTPPAASFTHGVSNGVVETSIVTFGEESVFQVSFPNPEPCAIDFDQQNEFCDMPDADFLTTNDEIYWNPVYDRALYGQNVSCEPFSVVPPGDVIVTDTTKWAAYVEPEVLELNVFFGSQQEYFLSPWFNVEEIEACE